MSTGMNEVDEIRRWMAMIRRDLHHDVQGVVATAEAATDWRRYIGMYPWASLGLAFALGYFAVPRRRHPEAQAIRADVSKVIEAVEATKQTVQDAAKSHDESRGRGKSLAGAALGMIGPMAFRAAQGYALNFLENWIAQQMHGQARYPTDRSAPRSSPPQGTGPRQTGDLA